MRTLIKNINIIHHNGDIELDTDIIIDEKIISDVGKNLSADECEIIDGTGKYISPTFVNMHTHSPMNIFKGIAEDVHIDDWFNQEIWPYESKMQDDDIYYGAKLAISEMLQNGISAFADHYFKSDIIAKACVELGIKADLAYTIFGFDGSGEEEIAKACEFFESHKSCDTLRPRFGPHSPYICTPEILKKIVDCAKQHNSGIHIHISETHSQVMTSKLSQDNKTPFQVVYEAGGFDVPCIVGHGLWIEESDLSFLNEKTCFAVCPKTYQKLGMYKGDLWKLKEHLNITSGTDGAASSNTLDVLEQIRTFALLGKWDDNSQDFTLKQVWSYLMNGHNFLDFNSGKVQKGYSADLNIWNLSTLSTAPVYNPLASIVYSATAQVNITDTLINGNFIKKDGKLCFDLDDIIKNASKNAKEIYKRGKGKTDLYF